MLGFPTSSLDKCQQSYWFCRFPDTFLEIMAFLTNVWLLSNVLKNVCNFFFSFLKGLKVQKCRSYKPWKCMSDLPGLAWESWQKPWCIAKSFNFLKVHTTESFIFWYYRVIQIDEFQMISNCNPPSEEYHEIQR